MRDLGGGRVNNADKRCGHFDRRVLRVQESRVIAAMTNEVLEFGPGIGIREGAALGLEDRADALVGRNHVEPREEVVVCQRDDALCGEKRLLEAGVERLCVVRARLVERYERVRRGDPSGCRGEARGGRGC